MTDPSLVDSLEHRYRELGFVIGRLEAGRSTLLPGPGAFWHGTARDTYNSAIDVVARSVDAALGALRSARSATAASLASVTDDA